MSAAAAAVLAVAGCRANAPAVGDVGSDTRVPTTAPVRAPSVTPAAPSRASAPSPAPWLLSRDAPDATTVAACAAFERLPRATPDAVVAARFEWSSRTPGPVATPERLPHLRYTFESQSEAALETYLGQWRDGVGPRSPAEIARLGAVEQAVYGAYAAVRFGPDALRYAPEPWAVADGADVRSPQPGDFIVLPTVVEVGCLHGLVDEAGAFTVDSGRIADRVRVHLSDFRPPSPDPARTLYLTAGEALAIHHYLGSTVVYDPPIGLIDVEGLPYPEGSARYEWLRRRLPVERTFSGSFELPTLPSVQRIVLDPALTHAVVDFRAGPSMGGSVGLANDGTAWRVVRSLGAWME